MWPALLIVSTGIYVFVWTMRVGTTRESRSSSASRTMARFGLTALALLALHAGSAPWTMTSGVLLRAGAWTATAAERVLTTLGVPAAATGNILVTSRGAFQMTQECLLTPLVPIYLAAAFALPMRRRTRAWLLLLALPVFFVLGILRVLVLALPPAIAASPLFVAHGFYQLVAGAALIVAAAAWAVGREREPSRRSLVAGRVVFSILAGIATAVVAGGAWASMGIAVAAQVSPYAPGWFVAGDVQGALPLLPVFQLGLLAGLWMALSPLRRVGRLFAALAALLVLQIVMLAALGVLDARFGVPVHALLIRALALLVPAGIAWLFFRPHASAGTYVDFWHGVGGDFPDLGGAASTALYRDDEIRLLSSQVDDWRGVRILKTDLWDEARNTRIMQWAAREGAAVFGVDISEPTLRLAHEGFAPGALRAALADTRRLPFADGSFDVVYSMGTIEHFDESQSAVGEMARVLRPGGRLVLGVPNRFDPFLRPLLVWSLWVLGRYDYGFEKSYSRGALRRMLERAGLTVVDESGILFIPGWLRMADLAAHARFPAAAGLTAPAVRLFDRTARAFPWFRRHGYLLASTATR
ncbi:MAG: methyltransferase domain-containing protein [Acidobacteria bacterium]|nr:methyltransferase domain-containing protein [Acidobacteriota bacterium]